MTFVRQSGRFTRLLLVAVIFFIGVLFVLPKLTPSAPASEDAVTLSPLDGSSAADIPPIGLGTWLSEKARVSDAVKWALDTGYRHIDAAAIYRNEKEVGKGIARSTLPRSSLWVTSKLWNDAHRPHLVRPAIEKTLSDLGLNHLDLYLMHWPVAFDPDSNAKDGPVVDDSVRIAETWAAMEDLVRAGLTRQIGISNFNQAQVEEILKHATIRPYAHEFEAHPYLQQTEFVAWNRRHGLRVIAYSPLANMNPVYHPPADLPPLLQDPFFVELAGTKNATAAQVVLAWAMQRGTIPIPKSVHEKYVLENLGATDITLTDEEMKKIQKRDRSLRFNDPSDLWGVRLFDGLDGSH